MFSRELGKPMFDGSDDSSRRPGELRHKGEQVKKGLMLWAVVVTIGTVGLGIGLGGAAAATRPSVICASCGDDSYPPPLPCNADSGAFATSWQGQTWFCFGGSWYRAG